MKVVTADEAVHLVHDGDTVLIGGSGGGHAVPEALIVALERRFLQDGHPHGITSLHPVGIGDEDTQGVSRFAHPGLLKRIVCGSFIDSPLIEGLASRDEIEAYTLPQGALSQLMRDMAAGRPGLITHVGLHTFVDPRYGGGRQSPSAKEDLVEVVSLAGREWLFYKPFSVDVAFLRGTTADEDGNVTMEQEAVFAEMLSMAQATRRTGGDGHRAGSPSGQARLAAGKTRQDSRHARRSGRGRSESAADLPDGLQSRLRWRAAQYRNRD